MSTITTLRIFDQASWKSTFVQALMHLCPDMNPDAADEVSDLEFAPNRTRSPAFAAGDWAAAHGFTSNDTAESKSA